MRRGHIDRNMAFLCEDSSCLSRIAEAAAKQLAPTCTRLFSAGVTPLTAPLHVIHAMQELAISMSGQKGKGLAEVPIPDNDLVVRFGDAYKKCDNLPRHAKVETWPVSNDLKPEQPSLAPISLIDKRLFALFLDPWRNTAELAAR